MIIFIDFPSTQNTITEWHSIFYVGAAIYIGTAVVFMLGGSGCVQPWNEMSSDTDSEEESVEKGAQKEVNLAIAAKC